MSKDPMPPRWADRFLAWYCNPELLEEIQGDAHELYFERLKNEGERAANFKYTWDVIRFCRMSNVRRTAEFNEPGVFGMFWNLNMKIAIRNSIRNKTVFFVKLSALAICLAFTFLLTGFVINEFSYDHHYNNYSRIYRVATKAEMQGKTTLYAVSPMALAHTLADEVPGIERATRFIFAHVPYSLGDKKFFDVTTYMVDSSFLRMFNQDYIQGSAEALDEPGRIVITESTAKRLFGETLVMGQSIDCGETTVEVGAVIRDLPLNTHMTFDILLSWSTFSMPSRWDDINAYSYVKLLPGAEIEEVTGTIDATASDYLREMSEEYDFKYDPIIQRLDEIHLSGFLDEDFATKRSRNYVYIIMSVIALFLLTGLFNYLNLALAELTTQVRKIAILRTFGGVNADHRSIALTDAILCMVIVAPLVAIIMTTVLWFPGILPAIDRSIWTSPIFIGLVAGLVLLILMCSSLNSIVISRSELMLSPIKGRSAGNQKGFTLRKFLVAAQLSFSIIMIGLISVIVDQFHFVNEQDKGFDEKDILVIHRPGKKESAVLEESIRKMAGVKSVTGTSFYPDGGVETKDVFSLETPQGMKNQLVNFIYCEKDYPALLDLRLKAGRFFDDEHSTDVEGAYVINETAAKEFGWTDPIGKAIEGPINAEGRAGEVIGVVEDFYFESMHTRIAPLIIFMGNNEYRVNFVYVKTEPMHSPSLLGAIEQEYHKLLPDVPFEYSYLDARYRALYKQDYEIRDIFRLGLIISIVVSALGIFSISALLLSLRTKEMGIRKVIGAENMQLLLMHLKPFITFFLVAIVIGTPVIFYLSGRWLNNFAYHIDLNAMYFILPAAITMAIILIASMYHAVRGSRVNPVEILKND
jgi:putative ABC transport system permease protein